MTVSQKNITRFERQPNGLFAIIPSEGAHFGTVGRGLGSIDYDGGNEAIRIAEKELLSSLTGIAPEKIVMLSQVHGADIVVIDEEPRENLPWCAEADGLVTQLRGICLVIRTADCVPVFVHDPVHGVLGAAHSGWRGCRLGIVSRLIRLMSDRYGSDPERLRITILPAIGPESYTVNRDVASHFQRDAREVDGSIRLDLWGNIERAAGNMGVPDANIFNSRRCTLLNRDDFYSHRNGDKGRNINFGYMLS